jgi:HAE1 family hydrophobic/amphiphilic exporter-1
VNRLYASPLRVYLMLGALAVVGIVSGFRLPVSLFPNSSRPQVSVIVPYGTYAASEFLDTYGKRLEDLLRNISADRVEVSRMTATYSAREAHYDLEFKWGVKPNEALKETQTVVNAFTARLPEESRDGTWVWLDNQNAGFFALSFYSDTRDLDALYDILEPALGAKLASVKDAQNPVLWNPSSREIRVELRPEVIASLGLFPKDIEAAVAGGLANRSGGSVTVGVNQLQIEMPRQVRSVEEFGEIPVPTPAGKAVQLSEIAHIDLGPKTMGSQSFKTSGAPSLILFATPKPGGNVKKMSEDLLALVQSLMPSLPPDVRYRVLVDPSEFIRSAVNNVFREVVVAAMLAVAVLFLFIGSARNVITAAIEIPFSMVLAFIMMRLFGMNLNLISLGGLALSAGMNVDGSVVVMENIFRHFEKNPGPHDFADRLRILSEAVAEVRFAIIASTVASLVVFLPLTLTSGLSYAILGDLALAVVFSHGFSAFVALILVPTVRLQLMSLPGGDRPVHSPIEKHLRRLEAVYSGLLGKFLSRPILKWATYGGLAALLVALGLIVLPRLPKEVVGKPDTDWMVLGVNTQGNTMLRQMEIQAEEVEKDLLSEFGSHILYTFNQIEQPNSAVIMARLKDKREMRDLWKAMEARFTSTPFMQRWVGPWNPSEMPIPDPPQLKIAIRGGELADRALVSQQIEQLLREKKVFPQISLTPDASRTTGVFLVPHLSQWAALRTQGATFATSDLADLVRVATTGRMIGYFPIKNQLTEIVLRFPTNRVADTEQVGAVPIGVGGKVVPLRALATPELRQSLPSVYRENSRDLFELTARENRGDEGMAPAALANAHRLIEGWERERSGKGASPISVTFENPSEDLDDAIHQLSIAAAMSIALIFLVLLLQFGSLAESLLVLVSIPLGLIGVLLSLFAFRSTLSLNSILGVILLNGIAVANSIILVDFIKRLTLTGKAPREAALEAARTRLRPILITSLTTVLGMLPIALGLGEGGHILQPLGIAVAGGLWVSMGLTLFLVPALQVSYLEWVREPRRKGRRYSLSLDAILSRFRGAAPAEATP